MQLLISVAGPAEAHAALRGGADVIDAKDPRHGALGPVSPERGAAGVRLGRATRGVALFGVEAAAAVAAWVAAGHAAGLCAALAGGLWGAGLARARSLGGDVVGGRGAACVGGRTGRVS